MYPNGPLTGDSRECEHSSPIETEQSTFSNKKESLCIDFMTITFRNEVLSPSWNSMLTSPRYEMLNATGISNHGAIAVKQVGLVVCSSMDLKLTYF